MALQSIKSGAFKFSKTLENLDKVSTAGSIIISVDDNTDLTGDIRVHDGITPGGISAPPPGTVSYIVTERKLIEEEFIANVHSDFITTAPGGIGNAISFTANYPASGNLENGPYRFFGIQIETARKDLPLDATDALSDKFFLFPTLRGTGETKFDITHLLRDASTGFQYPYTSELTTSSASNPNRKIERTGLVIPDDTEAFRFMYSFDADANTITISADDFIFPLKTGDKIKLQYVDGDTGFQDPDGWFYCDGRRVKKQFYSALFREIGDIWNISPSDRDIFDPGFYTNRATFPFQDIREYFSQGFEKRFDVNYSNGRVRVFKAPSGLPNDIVEVPTSDYSLGTAGDGQTYIRFPDDKIPQSGERILVVGTPDSDEFQIPDFRGFYLRAWNSKTYIDTKGVTHYTPPGIQSKKHYAVQKHSHFIGLATSGKHKHKYIPWEFGGNSPFAKAVWGDWPTNMPTSDTGIMSAYTHHSPSLIGTGEDFYGKWQHDATEAEVNTNVDLKRRTKLWQVGVGNYSKVEPDKAYRGYGNAAGYPDWSLDGSWNYSKDHVSYVLGSGPCNMVDFGPSRTENTTFNYRHKHFIKFSKTIIDPGDIRGRSSAALGYEGPGSGVFTNGHTYLGTSRTGWQTEHNNAPIYGHENYNKPSGTGVSKAQGGYRVEGRDTTSLHEVDITNIKLPTFIKY